MSFLGLCDRTVLGCITSLCHALKGGAAVAHAITSKLIYLKLKKYKALLKALIGLRYKYPNLKIIVISAHVQDFLPTIV